MANVVLSDLITLCRDSHMFHSNFSSLTKCKYEQGKTLLANCVETLDF